MVDTTIVEDILGTKSQSISDDLRAQIDSIHTTFQSVTQGNDINNLYTDEIISEHLPALSYITRINTIDQVIETAARDVELVQTLIQLYASLGDSLDQKIFSIIDALGTDAGRVFDYTGDGGINTVWHFGWYFYPGCTNLRNNNYIKYVLTWTGIIRYTNLAIASTGAFLVWYNKTNGHLPLLDVTMTSQFQVITVAIILWCAAVAYLPQYLYSWTTSSIPLCQWFRQLFIGAQTSATDDQIYTTAKTVSKTLRSIKSAREELSEGLRDMMKLSQQDKFKTYYWSKISFYELIEAITVGDQITQKDQNILVIILGIPNMLPLMRNPDFLMMCVPYIWNRFGWAFLVALSTTIALNIALLKKLATFPLSIILK